jgi:radical SAM superfamily enzyme YgiQ (UPF0313 family)
MEEFCQRFPREVGLPFSIWSHPGILREEAMAKLRAAGLDSVIMGVESGSQEVRRQVLNRPETDQAVVRSAEICHRLGITVGYDFIVDMPWMSEENCRGTFELLMRLPHPFEVGMHSLSFLPGTAITERALREGVIRPEQVSRADQPLPARFESHLWKATIQARSRKALYWHSLISLAAMPFVPRPLLRRLYRARRLLQIYPAPLAVAAVAARVKKDTGRARLLPAIEAVYPSLGGFLSRHPTLSVGINKVVRGFGRVVWGLFRMGRRSDT